MITRRMLVTTSLVTGVGLLASPFASKARADHAEVIATTQSGRVRGVAHGGVTSFKGIPYAAPTTGEGRFLPVRKPASWSGVRDAVQFPYAAPQGLPQWYFRSFLFIDPTNEDCLGLNVWTPAADGDRRPVMVWLHGGGFTSSASSCSIYDGANLARRGNVVVVSLNHRLNILGHLHLAELGGAQYAESGNLGVLDLVAGLEWVRDNIAAFGGDPNNVTIFGQSGGGAKSAVLMAMPKAKGLFHRAIAQSSASFVRMNTAEAATAAAVKALEHLGLKRDQVDDLRKVPVDRLLAAMQAVTATGYTFRPVVDGNVLPRHPFEGRAPEVSANVPLLIGTAETETSIYIGRAVSPDPKNFELGEDDVRGRIAKYVRISDTDAGALMAAYRKSRPNATPGDLLVAITTDHQYGRGSQAIAERKAEQRGAPAYTYLFTWKSPSFDGKLRSPHTIEVPFVFHNELMEPSLVGTGPEIHTLADRMSDAWIAFAKTGNPNVPSLPKWEAFDTSRRATMVFDNECKLVDDPHREDRLAFSKFPLFDFGPSTYTQRS